MRIPLTIAGTALLFSVAVTELASRVWPDSRLALLVLCALALLGQGILIARLLDREGTPKPASREPRRETKRSERPQNKPRSAPPPKPDGPREQGTVKWFNRAKGFGFIIRENGEEIFVHQRSIRREGGGRNAPRPALKDGQAVTFSVAEREKGLQAEDVAPA